MRIVLDVTPLSRPRTGIGNYMPGMVAGLAEATGGTTSYRLGPSGPARRVADPGVARGTALDLRLRCCHARRSGARAGAGWLAPVESVVGRLDVFHFSDWMYPSQRHGVRATTVHDLVPLRFPEWVEPATAPHARAEVREYRRAPATRVRNSRFTADEVVELLGVPTSASRRLPGDRPALPPGW